MKLQRFSNEAFEYAKIMKRYADEFPDIIFNQKAEIEKIYDILENCSSVHIYGKGRSGAIAVCFALRLSHFEFKPVNFLGDVIKNVISLDDMVILFSGSGDTSEVVEVAKKAHKIGAKIVSVTSYNNTSLAKYSDVLLLLPGGMEKGKGWSYLKAQLNEHPTFYGGGEFEFYAYLLQETILSAIGVHRDIEGSIIAKTHERDETLND
ncbi:MAG: SIS domain-containing protein [Nitrososphaerales archaeon]|nr:SIS domain-containing protein [Nitrososphaerales archaeon]